MKAEFLKCSVHLLASCEPALANILKPALDSGQFLGGCSVLALQTRSNLERGLGEFILSLFRPRLRLPQHFLQFLGHAMTLHSRDLKRGSIEDVVELEA
jgi:hypothetical protein